MLVLWQSVTAYERHRRLWCGRCSAWPHLVWNDPHCELGAWLTPISTSFYDDEVGDAASKAIEKLLRRHSKLSSLQCALPCCKDLRMTRGAHS